MKLTVKAFCNDGGIAIVIMSNELFITSAKGSFLIILSTIKNIISIREMKERASK